MSRNKTIMQKLIQSRQTGDLKGHQKYKHEGMIFACDQCEFRITVEFNLVFHKEAKLDGIRYLCHLCDYTSPFSKPSISKDAHCTRILIILM